MSTNPTGGIPGTVLGAGDIVQALDGVEPWGDPIGLDLDPDTPGALVGGLRNIRDSLLRRLRTPKGYLPHRPSYGSTLPGLVGAPLDIDLVVTLRDDVASCLESDARVIRVSGVAVNVIDDGILVDASVETEAGPLQVTGLVGGVV